MVKRGGNTMPQNKFASESAARPSGKAWEDDVRKFAEDLVESNMNRPWHSIKLLIVSE